MIAHRWFHASPRVSYQFRHGATLELETLENVPDRAWGVNVNAIPEEQKVRLV